MSGGLLRHMSVHGASRSVVAPWPSGRVAGDLAGLAHEALLREVRLTPKPGLVDLRNTGAHSDMDVGTFEASAAALRRFWQDFVAAGMASADSPAPEALGELRRIGLAAERAMRAATHGVNTHKGAIFAFGLLLGASGRLEGRRCRRTVAALCTEVALICDGLVLRELQTNHRTAVTAGEYIFRRYGQAGARGEAQSGVASVRQTGLPVYRACRARGFSEDRALLAAMVALLAVTGDTNLIARGGPAGAAFVRQEARKVLALGPAAPGFIDRLRAMDDALIARNLSPGGTADLVGITWFLAQVDAVPGPSPAGRRVGR